MSAISSSYFLRSTALVKFWPVGILVTYGRLAVVSSTSTTNTSYCPQTYGPHKRSCNVSLRWGLYRAAETDCEGEDGGRKKERRNMSKEKKRKRRIRGRTTGRESESLMTHRSEREEGEVRNTLKWPITCDRGRYTNLPARSPGRPLSLCVLL